MTHQRFTIKGKCPQCQEPTVHQYDEAVMSGLWATEVLISCSTCEAEYSVFPTTNFEIKGYCHAPVHRFPDFGDDWQIANDPNYEFRLRQCKNCPKCDVERRPFRPVVNCETCNSRFVPGIDDSQKTLCINCSREAVETNG